ncbi:MAG: protein kinase [Sandaracinaceae bacterium]|nr:protein kinase [Sandaracinaceae bacterium]
MNHPGAPGPDPLVGRVLDGRYRVERLLGGGGMGRVYDAVQVELGRRVALKVLIPELAKVPSILERFRREALASAVLGHPHIVDVTDFVLPSDGPPFLVMERLVGEPLVDVLTREGMLSVPRALRITVQLLDALQAAHEADIVHRDLKPANVFLVSLAGGDEMVKLLDFGIAKLRESPGNRKLTAVGEMVGTPRFAAPEQLKGGVVDARTDVYGAGGLLYGMLTGRPPFAGPDAELIRAVLEQEPPDPRIINPLVTPAVAEIITRAMAKDPAQRFQSARAMMDALGGQRAKGADANDAARPSVAIVAAQAGGAPKPSAAPDAPRRGPLALIVVAMLGVSLLLAGAAAFAGYSLGARAEDGGALPPPPPMDRSAEVVARAATCEEYLERSCTCPGEHRQAICDRARSMVASLRRSVQVGQTIDTVAAWCASQLTSGTVCAYDPTPPMLPIAGTLTEGVSAGALEASDASDGGAPLDRYALRLTAGERVEVWAMSDAFDTYLVLRDPSGRVVAANDDASAMADGTNAQLVYVPRAGGDYHLEVSGARHDQLGAYELILALGEPASVPRRSATPPRRPPQPQQQPPLPPAWRDDGRDPRGGPGWR